MKINYTYIIPFILIIAISFLCFREDIHYYLNDFAIKKAEQRFGARFLSPEQENKIRQIASEMRITKDFLIRKMNSIAISIFGYYNAFVYFSQFWNVIPLTNTPILFVSEGFFEDLSLEEQRFLISHELIHIKEHHCQYLNFIVWLMLILIIILAFRIKKIFISFMDIYFKFKHGRRFSMMLFCSLIYICCMIPLLGSYAYRRHIEFIADHGALTSLKEYDGAIKLIHRWNKEYGISLDNEKYGIFSDHPSCNERINYCLNLKNNHKDEHESF